MCARVYTYIYTCKGVSDFSPTISDKVCVAPCIMDVFTSEIVASRGRERETLKRVVSPSGYDLAHRGGVECPIFNEIVRGRCNDEGVTRGGFRTASGCYVGN